MITVQNIIFKKLSNICSLFTEQLKNVMAAHKIKIKKL